MQKILIKKVCTFWQDNIEDRKSKFINGSLGNDSLSLPPSLLSLSLSMTHTHISTITWIPIRDKNNWWKWLMLWCQAKSVKERRRCHEASIKSFPNGFFICSYGTLLQLDITHGPHKRYILNDKLHCSRLIDVPWLHHKWGYNKLPTIDMQI